MVLGATGPSRSHDRAFIGHITRACAHVVENGLHRGTFGDELLGGVLGGDSL